MPFGKEWFICIHNYECYVHTCISNYAMFITLKLKITKELPIREATPWKMDSKIRLRTANSASGFWDPFFRGILNRQNALSMAPSFSNNNNNNNNKGTQPTLRLWGAEQCCQNVLFQGYDTTRAPLLEASLSYGKPRSTHCIDPGGMKGWVNPGQDFFKYVDNRCNLSNRYWIDKKFWDSVTNRVSII